MMKLKENRNTLIAVIVVVACLYITSGGFFNQLIKPGPMAYWNYKWYIISPKMEEQTTTESFYVFTCNTMTLLGIFMMAASGDSNRSRLTSNRLMILGMGLLLAGWIGSYILIELKRLPWYS